MAESQPQPPFLRDLIQSYCSSSLSLSCISWKESTITLLDSHTYPSSTKCSFSHKGKTLTYSLLSLFLQIQDVNISLMDYRKICSEYKVEDPVKTLDKTIVLDFFRSIRERGAKGTNKNVDLPPTSSSTPSSSSHRKSSSSSSSKRHRPSQEEPTPSSSRKKEKKEKLPMTQDLLLQNLNIVVDKRAGSGKQESGGGDNSNDNHQQTNDANMTTAGDGDNADASKATATTQHESENTTAVEEPPKLLSAEEEEERNAIMTCLSSKGFDATQISPETLEKDRAEVEKIMSMEIPVGNSASILRCGAVAAKNSSSSSSILSKQRGNNGNGTTASSSNNARDFTRVLELYNESMKEATRRSDKHSSLSSKRPRGSSSYNPSTSSSRHASKEQKPAGKPIIIVPNAMTSPITLLNAHEFFQNSVFETRQEAVQKGKKKPSSGIVTVTRSVSSRLGGATIEYELMDNPVSKLKSKADWDRVVAVLPQGAAWQFKGWKMSGDGRGDGTTPVDVFSRAYGFYIGYESAPIPKDLQGWSVKRGEVSRDKRGLDSVVFASFWNGLDEWMSVHKSGFLPKSHGE